MSCSPLCRSAIAGFGERGAKARFELRREADLRNQDQRLQAALQEPGDEVQVDLGLAAAGDAVQQKGLEVAERRGDALLHAYLGRCRRMTLAQNAARKPPAACCRTFFGSALVERRRGGSAPITVSPSGRW